METKVAPARSSVPALVRSAATRAGRGLVDLVYPPTCIGCASAVSEPHALCPACWRALPLIERPFCERLGTPFAADFGGPLLSPAALADPPVFGRARAVARYDGLARDLVHRLKYGDRLDLAPAMALWMSRAGAELLADLRAENGVIVPVPMHRLRLWRRRMNQAAVLSKALQRLEKGQGSPVALALEGLARRRATRPQVGLSRAERAVNLQGVFAVPDRARAQVEGRRVLLVDDVLTTGATANAAARVLIRAGATAVDILVFARVCAAP
jgi:ComF family protein